MSGTDGFRDNGNVSGTVTIDFTYGSVQKITLIGNATLVFQGGFPGSTCAVLVCQDGTGLRTVSWPANIKWTAGVGPALTTTANKCDMVTFMYDGTNYWQMAPWSLNL